jgi:hypothetical protein
MAGTLERYSNRYLQIALLLIYTTTRSIDILHQRCPFHDNSALHRQYLSILFLPFLHALPTTPTPTPHCVSPPNRVHPVPTRSCSHKTHNPIIHSPVPHVHRTNRRPLPNPTQRRWPQRHLLPSTPPHPDPHRPHPPSTRVSRSPGTCGCLPRLTRNSRITPFRLGLG